MGRLPRTLVQPKSQDQAGAYHPFSSSRVGRKGRCVTHSITSSARPSSESGNVMPNVLAVLRLIASSTFTACMIEANLSQCITQARAVAHQTAGHNEFTQRVDRGQNVASLHDALRQVGLYHAGG